MHCGGVEDAESFVRRAHSHCHKDSVDGIYSALSCFIEAIKIAPHSPEIFLKFGDFFQYFMNDSKRAYSCYERAFLLKPKDPEVAVAYHCSQFELLSEEYSQRFLGTESLPALRRLIIHYMYSGDVLMAQRACDCAIDIDPSNFVFLMFRAELARLSGMSLSSSFKSFLREVESDWRFLVRLMITISSLRSGDFEDIADSIEDLVNHNEEGDVHIFKVLHAEVMCYLGDDLLSTNRYSEAFDLFLVAFDVLRALLSEKSGGIALFVFGYSSYRLAQLSFDGNFSSEFEDYVKHSIWAFSELALNSTLSSAYFNLALSACLFWRKKGGDKVRDFALGCCLSAITLSNGSCDSWLLLGVLGYYFEDYVCSEKALVKSLGASRNNERAIVDLSLLYYKCGAFKVAFQTVELSRNVSLSRDGEILLKLLLMDAKSDFTDVVYNYLLMALNSPFPSIHALRLFGDQIILKTKSGDVTTPSISPEEYRRKIREERTSTASVGFVPSSVVTRDSPVDVQINRALDGLVCYLEAVPFDVMGQSLAGSLMELAGYTTARHRHAIAFDLVLEGSGGLLQLSREARNVVFNAIRMFPPVDDRVTPAFVEELANLPGLSQIESLNLFVAFYNFGKYSKASNVLAKFPQDPAVIKLKALTIYKQGCPIEALGLLLLHECPQLTDDIFYLTVLLRDQQMASMFGSSLFIGDPESHFLCHNLANYVCGRNIADPSYFDIFFLSFFPITAEEFVKYLDMLMGREARTRGLEMDDVPTARRLIANCGSPPSMSLSLSRTLQTLYFLLPPFDV